MDYWDKLDVTRTLHMSLVAGKIGMDLYGAVMHQRESMMEDTIRN